MKKHLLYTLFGAASLMASCTEDFNEDVAAPQQWEQEEAIKLPGLQLQGKGSINIDLGEAGDSVTIFNPSLDGTMPEGGTLTNFNIAIQGKGMPDEYQKTIKASDNGKVATAELQAMAEYNFGKRPEARSYIMEVSANIIVNGQASLLTATDNFVLITVAAPQISKNYYLIGAPSAWEPTCVTMPFNHSDKDVYEDPIFTIVFPVSDGETWFAVADDITVETADWKQVFGCAEGNGANGEEGVLKRRADLTDDGSFMVNVAGDAKFIKMTLNMMEYTYKIEKLNFAEFIYVPGNHQGWAPDKAAALQSPNFDGVYVGYTYLNGNFKFTKERNWNGEYNFNDFATKDDIFFNNDGSNINISEEGFYQITADVAASKLSAVKTTWSIIGSATGDPNWGTDLEMTYVTEDESWTYTGALTAGEFKFRANKDWTLSFGGASFDDLTSDNGANLKIEEEGNYEVKFFLTRSTSDKIYCTVTKK